METELHNFKWEKHSWVVMTRLANLYRRDLLIDCTMYVEGDIIHAHKNLLAAVSPYFERLFSENPHKKSFDFDNMRHKDVKAVIDFLYFGFVKLPKDDMKTFLEAAEKFQIQIACESTAFIPRREESETQSDHLGNRERTNSLDDDWNSLIGISSIKLEPSESDSLPEVPPQIVDNGRMGEKTGADESRGAAETLISSSYQQRATNTHRGSLPSSGKLALSSAQEDRQNRRKTENWPASISPPQKKTPSYRRSEPFSPSRNLVSNSPRDHQHTGRKAENTQGSVTRTPKKSPSNHHFTSHSYSRNVVSRDSERTGRESEKSQSFTPPTRKPSPLSHPTRSLSPARNMTSNSEREIQQVCDQRQNSNAVGEKSPMVRQSRSRSPNRNVMSSSSRDSKQKEAVRSQSLIQPMSNQSALNNSSISQSSTINLESDSPTDNQRTGSKSEKSQPLISPGHKKSQLSRQSRSRSPNRSLKLNSSKHSKQTEAESPSCNQSSSNCPSTGRPLTVNSEPLSVRDNKQIPDDKSPVGRQSMSLSSTKSVVLNASRSIERKEAENSQLSTTLNHSSRSRTPAKNVGSDSQRDNREMSAKRDSSQTLKSTPKKSHSKSRSPDRDVVLSSQRSKQENEMKSKEKQSKDPSAPHAKLPVKSSRPSQSLSKKLTWSKPEDSQEEKSEKKARKEDEGTKKTWVRTKRKRRARSSSSDWEASAPSHKKKKCFTCKYCNEKGLPKGVIHSHALAHKGRKDFTCPVCEKIFETFAQFEEHRSTCLYHCEICNKKITRRYSLQQHMLLHVGERPFGCSECGKHYTSSYLLNTHYRTHFVEKEKKFECEVCGKAFSLLSSLSKHELIHTNERPFVCETCGKGFNDKTTLRRHILVHTGEKHFHCDQCDNSFSTKISLIRHVYIHMDESAKPYKCTECDRSFTQYVHVQRHMSSHTGVKPYSCKICGRAFGHVHHLTRHERTVHKSKRKTSKKD